MPTPAVRGLSVMKVMARRRHHDCPIRHHDCPIRPNGDFGKSHSRRFGSLHQCTVHVETPVSPSRLCRVPLLMLWPAVAFLVESRCGAVAVGRTYLLPPLSSDGA